MQTQWVNVFTLLLAAILIALLLRFWPDIYTALAGMGNIGPGHTTDEKTAGLLTLGIVGALIVALARILTSRGSK